MLTPPEPLHTAVPKLSTVRASIPLLLVPLIFSVAPGMIAVVPEPAWVPPVQSKAVPTRTTAVPPSVPPAWVRVFVRAVSAVLTSRLPFTISVTSTE